ncbi:MAG TPA: 1-(5-phosphoribosyl)-5-[(5-phosphoribosylamino)methylideneamino]imidazole-4-carboxamide isomerase [Bacteroidota bacterium]|nr:1-(5-phosphoribosyl)-5-[(5-phosphoribosylamino)methylideneamino]imidazole-4-carboxamide isomerase [Bacteroidota bacterium]
MLIIPAIDILGNSCVRLAEGSFDAVTKYASLPVDQAREFLRLGATYLHVVDLDGARGGQLLHIDAVAEIRKLPGLFLQVGGGIRSDTDVQRLMEIGVDRVVVGSIALSSPEILRSWIDRYGAGRFCVALDVKEKRVVSKGWQETTSLSVDAVIPGLIDAGVECFLSTDIRRDGMMSGPNVELYEGLSRTYPTVSWLASGGITTLEDVRRLRVCGVTGAIIGKALYEGKLQLEKALEEAC